MITDPLIPALLAAESIAALAAMWDALRRGWKLMAVAAGGIALASGATGAVMVARLP